MPCAEHFILKQKTKSSLSPAEAFLLLLSKQQDHNMAKIYGNTLKRLEKVDVKISKHYNNFYVILGLVCYFLFSGSIQQK